MNLSLVALKGWGFIIESFNSICIYETVCSYDRLNELLKFAEDLECDLPKFWDYIAEVIVHPVSSGRLPLAELKKAHKSVLQSGKIGKLTSSKNAACTNLQH